MLNTQQTDKKVITELNAVTEAVRVDDKGTVIIGGTFDADLTLQVLPDGESESTGWINTGASDVFTQAGEYPIPNPTGTKYRVKCTRFASGSANVWLRRRDK